MTTWKRLAAVAAIAALSTACGGTKHAPSPQAGTTTGAKPIHVGLVTDIGGLNDRSFNHLNYLGLVRAEHVLHVHGRVLQSNENADYVPNLSSLARQGYDLTIAIGFLEINALDTVATRFPKRHFAIVDVPLAALKHHPSNVVAVTFKEQEAGYLVGYLAGLELAHEGGSQVVGAVGGQRVPPVLRYIAGFQAGARAANKNVKVLIDYSQDFVDPAKCKELSLAHIAAGSRVEFMVAGGCGLGTLDAAKERHVWGIGGDADMAYMGPHILTSALKRDDVAVFDQIKLAQEGKFHGGDRVYGLANNGVGLGKVSPRVPRSIVAKVKAVERQILAGKIKPPTTPS